MELLLKIDGTFGIAIANLVALLFMLILYYNERKNN